MAQNKKVIDNTRLEQYNTLVKANYLKPSNVTVATDEATTITMTGVAGSYTDDSDTSVAVTADSKTINLVGSGVTIGSTTSGNSSTITFTVDDDLYSIAEQTPADSGYAKTYYLKKGDTAVASGEKINIPKDFLVKSARLKVVETADTPYSGAVVGDKYIDFEVNTVGGDETAQHIYLPVNDLVDVYTAGNGIEISAANVVSAKIDTTNANGLSVGTNGIALATAAYTTVDDTTTYSNGAMTGQEKEKLANIKALDNIGNGLEFDTSTNTLSAKADTANAITVSASGIGVNVAAGNGLSIANNAITMAVGNSTTPGAVKVTNANGLSIDSANGTVAMTTGNGLKEAASNTLTLNVDETNTFEFDANGVLGVQYASAAEIASLFA